MGGAGGEKWVKGSGEMNPQISALRFQEDLSAAVVVFTATDLPSYLCLFKIIHLKKINKYVKSSTLRGLRSSL